jgi:biotin synthase
MKLTQLQSVLDRLADVPQADDIESIFMLEDEQAIRTVLDYADMVRNRFVGDGIIVRGIVEFSNFCRNTCSYCGLNKFNNEIARYHMSFDEILMAVNQIARCGIKTVVLQSGEDEKLDAQWFANIITEIKKRFDIAVTLSVGERSFKDYALWKQAGADRFLLKIETSNKILYNKLHPGMSFENRLACSRHLRALGYQNGSGILVGLKGQTMKDMVNDILFFKNEAFDMLGVGPFIPHRMTALANERGGNYGLFLKMLALTRIITRYPHLPATTAGEVAGKDSGIKALNAGANVVMFDFTPEPFRSLYDIYPGKAGQSSSPIEKIKKLEIAAEKMKRYVDYSHGDSIKVLEKVI